MSNRIVYICNGPLKEAAEEQSQRLGCGTDLTDSIEAVPWDGQDHKVECPSCGTIAEVRRVPEDAAE